MYRLTSLNRYYDGMSFHGLNEAVAMARHGSHEGTQVDVVRDVDKTVTQVVWTRDIGLMPTTLKK